MRKYDRKVEDGLLDDWIHAKMHGEFVRPILPEDANTREPWQDMLYGFLSQFSKNDMEDLALNGLLNAEKDDGEWWHPMEWWDEKDRKHYSGSIDVDRYVFRYNGITLNFTWERGLVARNFWCDLFDRKCCISLYKLNMKYSDGKSMTDDDISQDKIQRVLDALGAELRGKLDEIRERRKKEIELL